MAALCTHCYTHNYCVRRDTQVVTDADLSNPEFIRDVRKLAFDLQVKPSQWLGYLYDALAEYVGLFVDKRGQLVEIDLDLFEVEDELLFNGASTAAETARESMRLWFKDFCCTPCPPETRPMVRRESKERVRVLATILRAAHPRKAMLWGLRPANDNDPLPVYEPPRCGDA